MPSIFDQLESQLAANPDKLTIAEIPQGKSFPETAAVTLMSINYYENGHPSTQKDKWSDSDFTFNWQMFTDTNPFTPSKSNAVWFGTTQLLDPEFFVRYIEGKGHHTTMGDDLWTFYKDLYRETVSLPKVKNGPRLGQFRTKYPGDVVHWGDCVRMRWDEFDELNCDVFRDGNPTPLASIVVGDPANNLKDPKNLLRGRYDPKGLWKPKHARKAKA